MNPRRACLLRRVRVFFLFCLFRLSLSLSLSPEGNIDQYIRMLRLGQIPGNMHFAKGKMVTLVRPAELLLGDPGLEDDEFQSHKCVRSPA